MLGRDEVETIVNKALRTSKADETEISLGGGHLHLVRLTDGAARESWGEQRYELRVRVQHQRRVGVARTDRIDDASVAAAVRRAFDAALGAPESLGLAPLPGPTRFPESTHFDPSVELMPPSARLAYVAPFVLEARRHGAQAGGVFAARAGSLGPGGVPGLMAIANSHGLFAFHRTTRLRFDARVRAGAGSGWSEAEHWLAGRFDPTAAWRRALAKALAFRQTRPLPAGKYEVILEPAAVASFLRSLAPHFSARAVDEGWSFVRGRQGRAIARGNVTLRDDFQHPLHIGAPFDGEGIPRTRLQLIWRGKVQDLVYSREAAKRHGVRATGHAPLQPSHRDALPQHLVLEGQDRSVEELIASCGRGILVTRVGPHRVVDPALALTAGCTCDGTFWIEGGKIKHALPDLCYEVGVFDLLGATTLMSRPEKALGYVAPAIKVKNLRILGAA